jgi:hypothetical protein
MLDERLEETTIPSLASVHLRLSVMGRCSEVEGMRSAIWRGRWVLRLWIGGCEPEEEHFGEIERAGLRVWGREFVKSLRERASAGAFEVRC